GQRRISNGLISPLPLLFFTQLAVLINTSSQLEKPRYVVLTFQTARKNDIEKNMSRFDHCKLVNVSLFLNDKYYPYDNLNQDIAKDRYALLYDMYARFQYPYYHRQNINIAFNT
ncbi:MAG: hypothetical protein ACTS7E_00830, partial [Arsenophonus sp. NC-CH8-MAG3]